MSGKPPHSYGATYLLLRLENQGAPAL